MAGDAQAQWYAKSLLDLHARLKTGLANAVGGAPLIYAVEVHGSEAQLLLLGAEEGVVSFEIAAIGSDALWLLPRNHSVLTSESEPEPPSDAGITAEDAQVLYDRLSALAARPVEPPPTPAPTATPVTTPIATATPAPTATPILTPTPVPTPAPTATPAPVTVELTGRINGSGAYYWFSEVSGELPGFLFVDGVARPASMNYQPPEVSSGPRFRVYSVPNEAGLFAANLTSKILPMRVIYADGSSETFPFWYWETYANGVYEQLSFSGEASVPSRVGELVTFEFTFTGSGG